jgi:hypothetical protein
VKAEIMEGIFIDGDFCAGADRGLVYEKFSVDAGTTGWPDAVRAGLL